MTERAFGCRSPRWRLPWRSRSGSGSRQPFRRSTIVSALSRPSHSGVLGLPLWVAPLLQEGIATGLLNLAFFVFLADNLEQFLGGLRLCGVIVLSALAGQLGHALMTGAPDAPLIGSDPIITALTVVFGLSFFHVHVDFLLGLHRPWHIFSVPTWGVIALWTAVTIAEMVAGVTTQTLGAPPGRCRGGCGREVGLLRPGAGLTVVLAATPAVSVVICVIESPTAANTVAVSCVATTYVFREPDPEEARRLAAAAAVAAPSEEADDEGAASNACARHLGAPGPGAGRGRAPGRPGR